MLDTLVDLYDDFSFTQRVESISRIAYEQNFDFDKKQTYGEQPTDWKRFKLFQKKGVRRLLGVITLPLAQEEGWVRFYDYYKTADLETQKSSVIEIYRPGQYMGDFFLKPKIKTPSLKIPFLSRNDENPIREEYDQSRKTTNRSNQELYLSDICMNLLLKFPKITVECIDDRIIFYRKGKHIQEIEILEHMDFAEEFVENLTTAYSDDFV